MNRSGSLRLVIFGLVAILATSFPSAPAAASAERPPNVIIILTDDQGYSDVGVYGAEGFETPYLDRMAQQGMRFTDFHVAAPVCSPSRAALLTGCYPQRVSVPEVLLPQHTSGLNPAEMTIADLLKRRGYATAAVGKWHLGNDPSLLPTNNGFDSYFGLPYSNDMSPHPEHNPSPRASDWPELPLYRDTEVIELNPDQRLLTKRYTQESIEFIESNKDKPFFLYLAHSMPHVPLYVSEEFEGRSARGLYGDVIEEVDWSVGQILKTVDRLKLAEKTLVIFTSDNGPWLAKKADSGSAKPLRFGKMTVFEGGMRVPCIMRWSGRVPEGVVCHELASTMDLLPTLALLAGGEVPKDRIIDGHDIRPLIFGEAAAQTPWAVMYFYYGDQLRAVRAGPWKLHVAGGPLEPEELPALYNLQQDLGEMNNLADEQPEIVARLQALAAQARQTLGDKDKPGSSVRPPAQAAAAGSGGAH